MTVSQDDGVTCVLWPLSWADSEDQALEAVLRALDDDQWTVHEDDGPVTLRSQEVST